MSTNIYIIIPVFNEERVISSVISAVRRAGYRNIIVVDDGSTDDTYHAARKAGATVVRHAVNRGKGAAVKTGIEAAKILGATVIVTMDGDGQHEATDISRLLAPLSRGYDVSLGTRMKNPNGMPFVRRIANTTANIATWLFYGLWVSDSQSGFRAYSSRAFNEIQTTTDRYEYDSEVIREMARRRLRFTEVPIKATYTSYSMGKKEKQSFANGIRTLLHVIRVS